MTQTPPLKPEVFKGLLVTYTTIIMLNAMGDLKGTVLYSAKLEKALDEHSRLKQRRIFRGDGSEDQAVNGAVMVEKIIYAVTAIAQQPDHVQANFDRDLETLMIRYGVNMIEMEKI